MPDEQDLEKSVLYQHADAGAMKETRVVGSAGYPLIDWVLVPYAHRNLIDVACVQQEDRGGAGDRQGCVRKAEGAVEHPVEEIRGEDVGPPSHVGRVLPKGARVLLTIAVTLPTTGERIDLLLWLCSQLLCIIVVTFAACDLGFCLGLRNL